LRRAAKRALRSSSVSANWLSHSGFSIFVPSRRVEIAVHLRGSIKVGKHLPQASDAPIAQMVLAVG
jgi:hypothetical protein